MLHRLLVVHGNGDLHTSSMRLSGRCWARGSNPALEHSMNGLSPSGFPTIRDFKQEIEGSSRHEAVEVCMGVLMTG